MKRYILTTTLLLCIGIGRVFALSGGYSYYLFYTEDGKPYLEIYYWVDGKSIAYKSTANDKKQGELEVLLMVNQGENVFSYEKFNLKTFEFDAKDSLLSEVYDVKRLMLPEGTSYLELFIKDLNKAEGNDIISKDTIDITRDLNKVFISDVQLIEAYRPTEQESPFSKGGYDILPYHGSFYSSENDKLTFYTELHNTQKVFGKGGKYVINIYMENAATGMQLQNFTVRKKMIAADFTPLLSDFTITELAMGTYNFVIEIRDSVNTYVTKNSVFIEKENLYTELREEDYKTIKVEDTWAWTLRKDSLEEYIHSLRPICEGNEYQFAKNVIKENDESTMRKFIYAFWTNRFPDDASNPYHSYSEFKSYNNLVYEVNEAFGTILNKGYLTDRGRVMLRYGVPNSISQRHNEPSAYPYEIWYYYHLKAQNRVKFVFYNDNMVGNEFRLLHSDLRGEIQNRQWEMMLHQRNNSYNGDQNQPVDYYGNWSRDLYNNPR